MANVSRRTFAVTAGAAALAAGAALSGCIVMDDKEAKADEVDVIAGSSTKIDPETQLTQEEIKDLILDYLHGWPLKKDENGNVIYSYREMYAIATSYNNHPGLSQVEFILDPETMTFLGSGDKGTEKCLHIPENDEVVMYWCHQVPEAEYIPYKNDYFNSYGVQIKGKAHFLTPDEDGAFEFVGKYLETLYGAEAWAATSDEDKQMKIENFFNFTDWIKVEPTEIIANSLLWVYNSEKSPRPEFYDPDSPFFGKAVRQVYNMK